MIDKLRISGYDFNFNSGSDGTIQEAAAAVRSFKELIGLSSCFSEEGHVKDVYVHHGKSNKYSRPITNGI